MRDKLRGFIGRIRAKKETPENLLAEIGLFLPNFLDVYDKVMEEKSKDGLTGLYTKGELYSRLETALDIASDHDHPTSVLMIDLDHFKGYNDAYGHLQGDEAIKALTHTMKRSVDKKSDVLARYGGEEFVMVLPEAPSEKAISVAEKIRSRTEHIIVPRHPQKTFNTNDYTHITCSLGVVTCDFTLDELLRGEYLAAQKELPEPERRDFNLGQAVLNAADTALYHAKKTRNSVAVYLPGMKMPEKEQPQLPLGSDDQH